MTSASVVPEWGANVVDFSFQRDDWTSPLPILELVEPSVLRQSPTSYGIPLLAPTPGRIGPNQNGKLTYRGQQYSIRPTRHGFVRQAAWDVVSRSDSEIICGVQIRNEPAADELPFDFRAEHRITLGSRSLRSRVRLENTGDRTQPLNVGWHPYLHRSPGPCEVRIPASSRWELDGGREPIPTGKIVEDRSFQEGRTLEPDEHWDDVFTDLSFEGDTAICWTEQSENVRTTSGRETTLRVRRIVEVPRGSASDGIRPVPNVQLYTAKGRNAISIEPLSSPPDAINMLARDHPRNAVCELEPGEAAVFEITIRIQI